MISFGNGPQVADTKQKIDFFCVPFGNISYVPLFLLSDLRSATVLLVLLTSHALSSLVWIAAIGLPFQTLTCLLHESHTSQSNFTQVNTLT